jgi:hypothetical protein
MCTCVVMAAPNAEPSGTAGSSVAPVPDPSRLQPESGSNPEHGERDRSADSHGPEPQGGLNQADPLVLALAEASRQFDGTGADPERNCWLAVHRHAHGVLPSEYDIREIDEDLYLAVLACRLSQDAG